ncbi:aminodeoxychorismate lyase [Litchfieldella qijiaojingensis]|uniref:Aminodeoxychorismate lyase n=1 Tax=Litchfieldella qijiaojingensis TaxID=980347 RepID=A0ABQ2YEF8_9GAMM|nr:aminodeoxychorismate lyase [Halomonas qijiaojingensis]GGX81312.1 aminodeoxychorismate lyase [Halomonas qijiaojingensis]
MLSGDAPLPVDDRGVAYGDGLFETVLVRDGRPCLWDYHMARLQAGCRRLGIPMPERDVLDRLPAQAGVGLLVLKLILTRGSGGRGYLPPEAPEPHLRWQCLPFTANERNWREGVRIRHCVLRLAIQPALAGLKHLNRLENVLARREWSDPGTAEGLLCDQGGRMVEATCMNVFWRRRGVLETPGLDRCGVAGTLRQALLERLAITEVEADPRILGEAEALWLGNSVQGVWPVIRLDDTEGHPLVEWQLTDIHREFQNVAQPLLGYPALPLTGTS